MGSEGVMLSEMSQRKTNTVWYLLYVESTEKQQTTEYNKKKSRLTDKETKLVVTSGEREEARGKMGVRD